MTVRSAPQPLFCSIGQSEKNSVRAYVFRFAPELGHCSTQSACLKRAITGSDSITSSAGNSNVGIVEQQRLARDVERALDSPPRIIPRMSEADRRPGTF